MIIRSSVSRMARPLRIALLTGTTLLALSGSLMAATGSTGTSQANSGSTTGCADLAQAASNGIAAEVAANAQIVKAPQSVTQLSCLSSFLQGKGLDVITNLLNPADLLNSIEGKMCQAAQSAYSNAIGSAQCGITLTGFNLGGFGISGFGNFCPQLSLGGGGPDWASIGGSLSGGQSSLYMNGTPITPSGYPSASAGTSP